MKTGLLALILLLPTFAAAKTGSDLKGDCSVALRLFDNQNVSGDENFIKIGNCMGFVTGIMQASALGKASPGNSSAKDPPAQFCVPPDLSVEQVVRMALKRLENHPEELQADAAVIVLRAMNEGFAAAGCIGSVGKQPEGLQWPGFPKKAPMRVRLVGIALAEPRSSYFSSHEVLVAETEIGDEEWSLIKLVFTYLPYQPRLSESGFDYSVVHEVLAWRNTNCDETVADLTARSLPDRHQPLTYARNVPREDLDRRRIPLPCYEAKADDYVKSSLEPIGSSAKPSRPAFVRPDPSSDPDKPVLKERPKPTPE